MANNRWSVPIGKVVGDTKAGLELRSRKITLEVFRKVVLRSPVDTGRFRANWNVSYQTADVSTTESINQARGESEAAKSLTLPIGGVQWISNGLPYGERLEYGWSKQAPAGMVRITAAEFTGLAARS